MPPINVLIKPASSKCNMRCRYCFYRDVAGLRQTADTGIMSDGTLKALIRSAIEYSSHICSFTFQGGEPTVAGLEFFEKAVAWQRQYRMESGKKNLEIRNSIQTNGYIIDEKWADFFRRNRFLVGLSLDGPIHVHDRNRVDARGEGTFTRIMRSVELLNRYHVDYNVLSVVTGQNAMSVKKIYRYFVKQGFSHLQFIPCLEPLGKERGEENWALSIQEYGDFLIQLFDLWYADLNTGHYISIRHLDNWLFMMSGQPPEACNMNGRCSIQFVVESDGKVYPCDFYVLDEWMLGTVGRETFQDILDSPRARKFVEASKAVPKACRDCLYGPLCRNGCMRDRAWDPGEKIWKNYYCESIYRFFSEREPQFREAARILSVCSGT